MSGPGGYAERVERLFEATPGAGRPAGPGWVSGEAREALSATHVRWHLRAAGGRIVEARYEVRGCPHTVAAAALAAALLPGRALEDLTLDLEALRAEIEAPAEKLGRLFVIQDAIHSAALLLGAATP